MSIPVLRAERDALRAEMELGERGATVLQLHPTAIDAYLAAVDPLDAALAKDAADGEQESRAAFRNLVGRVTVQTPTADAGLWI